MPASIAASAPRSGSPLKSAATKPQTAPTAIIPSTPRLRTPERSATSSPRAARRSGVEAVMMVRTEPSSIAVGRLNDFRQRRGPAAADEAHAVENEGVAGEDEKKQHPLEHASDLLGDAEGDLRPL